MKEDRNKYQLVIAIIPRRSKQHKLKPRNRQPVGLNGVSMVCGKVLDNDPVRSWDDEIFSKEVPNEISKEREVQSSYRHLKNESRSGGNSLPLGHSP